MAIRKLKHRDDDFLPAQVVAAGIGGAVLLAGVIAGGLWALEQAPFPYVWRDVALVHFVSALPLATLLALFIRRRVSPAGAAGLAALLLGLGVFLIVQAAPTNVANPSASQAVAGAIQRGLPALSIALAAALAVTMVLSSPGLPGRRQPPTSLAGFGALGVAILLVVPAIYVQARCRNDAIRLTGLLDQYRYAEALALARGLISLDPAAKWSGESAAEIQHAVKAIASRASAPLPADATSQQRLDRARDLAMLGRTDAALEILQSAPALLETPDACNLRATIHETRSEWEQGRRWYGRAKQAWQPLPPSPQRSAGLVQAVTGIAYCERKLGHYPAAEAAYQELVALSPTAHAHFLLARFYEDTQQAAKAQFHARRAMALAPDRFGREGQELIDNLVTLHFGCWSVFAAERDASGTSLGAPTP